MDARPISEWKDWNVTARDVAAHGDVVVYVGCTGCRRITAMNIWKVGNRLADTPLQRLRLRCSNCGVYPTSLTLERHKAPQTFPLLTIKLNPAAWDEGHETAQRKALARAEKRWKAQDRAARQASEL